MKADEIIREIHKAAAERIRECGHKHVITQWPVTPEEWDLLAADASKHCSYPSGVDLKADEMVLHTQFGKITIRKGPP